MTRIKTAWEKAMERTEEKNKNISAEDIMRLECKEVGQRLAGQYLTDPKFNLSQAIAEYDPQRQKMIFKAMADMFLIRLVLPQDEQVFRDNLIVMEGLVDVKEDQEALVPVLEELKHFFNYYLEAVRQARHSLEQQLVSHLEEIMLQKGMSLGPEAQLNAQMHPKYQEEWAKFAEKLNEKFQPPFTEMRQRIESLK